MKLGVNKSKYYKSVAHVSVLIGAIGCLLYIIPIFLNSSNTLNVSISKSNNLAFSILFMILSFAGYLQLKYLRVSKILYTIFFMALLLNFGLEIFIYNISWSAISSYILPIIMALIIWFSIVNSVQSKFHSNIRFKELIVVCVVSIIINIISFW